MSFDIKGKFFGLIVAWFSKGFLEVSKHIFLPITLEKVGEICHHIYDQTYKYRNIASEIPLKRSFTAYSRYGHEGCDCRCTRV